MTIHRMHPDPACGDPEDAILYDDCERCDEHADQLSSLDSSNARRLVARLLNAERLDGHYLTHAEAKAGRRLLHAAVLIGRATGREWPEVMEQ